MNLWRIEDGIPSIADGLLVAAAPSLFIASLVATLDPVLNYFEPRGLLYLGYAIIFLSFAVVGGVGFLVFLANQNKIREEIRIPRFIFAVSAVPVLLILHTAILAWLFPALSRRGLPLDGLFSGLALVLIALFAVIYPLVVKAALRYPGRTTSIAIWFNLALGFLGVVAKGLALLYRR